MKSNDDLNSNDYTRHFQIKTAKFISILLIIVLTIYHGYLNLYYGRNSCNRLLGEGNILGDNEWQPFGCMMHKYNKIDIDTCFKYVKFYEGMNSFVFIGDTRIKQIYFQFIKQFDQTYKADEKLNQNFNYYNKNFNLDVNFYWFSMIDESLNSLIEKFAQEPNKKPSFMIIGLGSWYVEHNATIAEETLESYKTSLTSLIDALKFDDSSVLQQQAEAPKVSTQTAGQASENGNSDMNIYWMLQDPIDEYKYKQFNNQTKINNKQIDLYNRATISLLHHSQVKIWSSSRLAAQGYNKDSPDGFSLGSFVLDIDSQMLYNLYCNNKMNFNDGSCCSQPENMSLLQKIIFSFFIICCIITIYLYIYQRYCKNSKLRVNISGSEITLNGGCKDAASNGFYTFLSSLSKLAVIMLYFYACDSANFYMKENKHYTNLSFLIPLIYVTVLGLFFHDTSPTTIMLNRQQTDECKGFMQIIILVYRISGGDKNTILYMLSRVFSSSYLFLHGYGHFSYYWNTGTYSATRFFEILFRLNFLPILLCFTMNRMYQFYSFIPFVSFWFICIYLIMCIPPRVSVHSTRENPMHYLYMIVKLLLFAGLITTLNMSEVIFEKLFLVRPWKFLFVTADDLIHDWKTSWKRDTYTVLYGMGFALILCFFKRINIINDNEDIGTSSTQQTNSASDRKRLFVSKRLNFLFILLSISGIIIYTIFIFLCSNKQEYEDVHPYLTILPIVSYMLLRNLIWSLREKCSYLFSWFGKITLELYICSFHILLAADSNGILVFLPGYPVFNILLTLFIFICIAHELNLITKSLIVYFIPNNWKIILRNFCVFIILLMPIAIKYGYI